MIFGEMDSLLSLLERLRHRLKRATPETKPENVSSRFVRLFESHGVHRNQIPRFFGNGLSLADVNSDESLLVVLNDEILSEAAKLFGVRIEWLEGAEPQIYPLNDFYKAPEDFAIFLDELVASGNRITGTLFTTQQKRYQADALLVLEEQFTWLGDRPVVRYYLCDNWFFTYWKSRAYLTACIAYAWHRGVYVKGRDTTPSFISDYSEGEMLIGESLGRGLGCAGRPWYPEDMALDPDAFLKGLDEGEFGARSALQLWLTLESKGFMKIRQLEKSTFRGESFESRLRRLSAG